MLRFVFLAGLSIAVVPAYANDTTAELGAGGLILSRTDQVQMKSEDLFISPDKVAVDYVFGNDTDQDATTIVAFPLPDIEGNPEEIPALPNNPSDNFLGFQVTIDGRPVTPNLEQRAFAAGLEVTDELNRYNVPLYPFGDAAKAALARLQPAVLHDMETRGIVVQDPDSADASDESSAYTPFWQLRSTYWWRATFPAHKDVRVSHRYTPSVGSTAGLTFFYDGKFQGEYDTYKLRYCLDDTFEKAVARAAKGAPDGSPRLFESRIAYILTTGGNWALGSIGKFRLTIDKGSARNLVSFCGDNVKKIGPTTFQMTADDYYPDHDVNILLLQPYDADGGTQN